jgi:microcystin-dependent protein
MATPYIGEIRAYGFGFPPVDWALCNGQLLSIAQYSALFNLIGTTYGGDGTSTFGVPNLNGRVPMHQGTSSQITTTLGQVLGTENVTLTSGQMPAHTHAITVAQVPSGGVVEVTGAPKPTSYLGETNADGVYNKTPSTLNATAGSAAIGLSGGSQPHVNQQPYLTINFCISLYGIYPSQT